MIYVWAICSVSYFESFLSSLSCGRTALSLSKALLRLSIRRLSLAFAASLLFFRMPSLTSLPERVFRVELLPLPEEEEELLDFELIGLPPQEADEEIDFMEIVILLDTKAVMGDDAVDAFVVFSMDESGDKTCTGGDGILTLDSLQSLERNESVFKEGTEWAGEEEETILSHAISVDSSLGETRVM